jgi:hypothetical protein
MLTLLETLPNALPTFTRYKTDDSLHAVKPMDFEAGRNLWPSIADESKDPPLASYLTVPTHKTTVVVEVVSPSPLSGLLN